MRGNDLRRSMEQKTGGVFKDESQDLVMQKEGFMF